MTTQIARSQGLTGFSTSGSCADKVVNQLVTMGYQAHREADTFCCFFTSAPIAEVHRAQLSR